MMNNLNTILSPILEYRLPPAVDLPSHLLCHECPKGIRALLEVANGFITTNRLFRVFGTKPDSLIPSIDEWNATQWKVDYGNLASDILFIAEDIFGDQYGYRFGEKREFVKFYCEGGETEVIKDGINWFIASLLNPFTGGALDVGLTQSSQSLGIIPKANEHLAFKIPLVIGGKRDIENIAIESVALHLGTLAQLSRKNLGLSSGAKISVFRTIR